ncbi:hypothetical protein B0H16DRAFT_355076 [Mycena metata]|uniref:Uncharacterized protein n=1 Tax=Mycena metata TaxID=1033252 RepID=A0AAD7JML5_9AGAR|nr:hypothetical protein B0H16DRAFT_355076 [Mycena metata]
MPAGGGSIDAGPGPAPSYGGSAQAGWWWDRTRGREGTDLYAESRGQERVGAGEDDGWADGGVSFGVRLLPLSLFFPACADSHLGIRSRSALALPACLACLSIGLRVAVRCPCHGRPSPYSHPLGWCARARDFTSGPSRPRNTFQAARRSLRAAFAPIAPLRRRKRNRRSRRAFSLSAAHRCGGPRGCEWQGWIPVPPSAGAWPRGPDLKFLHSFRMGGRFRGVAHVDDVLRSGLKW